MSANNHTVQEGISDRQHHAHVLGGYLKDEGKFWERDLQQAVEFAITTLQTVATYPSVEDVGRYEESLFRYADLIENAYPTLHIFAAEKFFKDISGRMRSEAIASIRNGEGSLGEAYREYDDRRKKAAILTEAVRILRQYRNVHGYGNAASIANEIEKEFATSVAAADGPIAQTVKRIADEMHTCAHTFTEPTRKAVDVWAHDLYDALRGAP